MEIIRIQQEQRKRFHAGKVGILEFGLGISSYVNGDDTCARYKGKNGYARILGMRSLPEATWGRRCRNTFTSLKKTCRKMSAGFWRFLEDRVSGKNLIPSLPDLMRLKVLESPV
jgi:hypothetical protein